jgi:chromosome partitioning protein
MIITVASYKGGVAKTTTAVHLATYLQTLAPTLLLDGDDTRNASEWVSSGEGFGFSVADQISAAMLSGSFTHTVIDTGQRPMDTDLRALAKGCHLLVIPAVPAGLDTLGLIQTINALKQANITNYRVLLTKVPPPPETEGVTLRAELTASGIPLFKAEIPRLKAFDKAFAANVPVSLADDPRADRAWQAYEAVGKEIIYGGK